jgi:hypothetical protein
VVAQACNLNYSAGRDQVEHCLKIAQAKSSEDPISINKSWDVEVYTCHPNFTGSLNRRIMV